MSGRRWAGNLFPACHFEIITKFEGWRFGCRRPHVISAAERRTIAMGAVIVLGTRCRLHLRMGNGRGSSPPGGDPCLTPPGPRRPGPTCRYIPLYYMDCRWMHSKHKIRRLWPGSYTLNYHQRRQFVCGPILITILWKLYSSVSIVWVWVGVRWGMRLDQKSRWIRA